MITPIDGLKSAVRTLHAARCAAAELKASLDEKREAVVAQFALENVELIDQVNAATSSLADYEKAVRASAAEVFKLTPDADKKKSICPGVTITESEVYNYETPSAFDWAVDHKMCLALDDKAFKTLCKNASTRPDFVAVDTKLSTRVDTDLGIAVSKINAELSNG